jgi:hypothetical protein
MISSPVFSPNRNGPGSALHLYGQRTARTCAKDISFPTGRSGSAYRPAGMPGKVVQGRARSCKLEKARGGSVLAAAYSINSLRLSMSCCFILISRRSGFVQLVKLFRNGLLLRALFNGLFNQCLTFRVNHNAIVDDLPTRQRTSIGNPLKQRPRLLDHYKVPLDSG